jgi:hypothetical protein
LSGVVYRSAYAVTTLDTRQESRRTMPWFKSDDWRTLIELLDKWSFEVKEYLDGDGYTKPPQAFGSWGYDLIKQIDRLAPHVEKQAIWNLHTEINRHLIRTIGPRRRPLLSIEKLRSLYDKAELAYLQLTELGVTKERPDANIGEDGPHLPCTFVWKGERIDFGKATKQFAMLDALWKAPGRKLHRDVLSRKISADGEESDPKHTYKRLNKRLANLGMQVGSETEYGETFYRLELPE